MHNIDDVDCIWNISMFKGHKMFKQQYGSNAWIEYMNTVNKYQYKLGISKYSHHIKNLNKSISKKSSQCAQNIYISL